MPVETFAGSGGFDVVRAVVDGQVQRNDGVTTGSRRKGLYVVTRKCVR